MELKSKFIRTWSKSLIAFILLTTSNYLFAQEQKSEELKSFKIQIESSTDGIKMKSFEGSAWIDLSFSMTYNKPEPINEYGMTTLEDSPFASDDSLANYLFTIEKTKKGLVLKGYKGTAWKELSFNLSEKGKQTINQFGMTE